MAQATMLKSTFALLIIVLGNLQAWDSDVQSAGLWTVLLVSLAIGLPAVAVLAPVQQVYQLTAIILAFILLLIARLISPVPLPELFLILIPAVTGLIFSGLIGEKSSN